MRYQVSARFAMLISMTLLASRAMAQVFEEESSLADMFLVERERISQRDFDEVYRDRVLRKLAATLSRDELQSLASDPGAAPAVLGPAALGSSLSDLTFTPIDPCRVVDTRLAGGAIVGGTSRAFHLTGSTGFTDQGGSASGCGIPVGATAAVLNIAAVRPEAPGYLVVYPYDEPAPPVPSASILNFGPIRGLNALANGSVVKICDPLTMTCTFDIYVFAQTEVDVVVDVGGYFTTFPTGEVIAQVLSSDGSGSGLDADLLDGLDAGSFQTRIVGSCPEGQSIRAIDGLGGVTCELDDDASGTFSKTISALSCVPQGDFPSGDAQTCRGDGTIRTSGDDTFPCLVRGVGPRQTYVCPLDLPSGALIEEILAFGADSSLGGYIEAAVWRSGMETASATYISPTFGGTWQSSGLIPAVGDTSFPIYLDSDPPHAVLADSRYMIGFATQGTPTSMYGFRVSYTMVP